MDESQICEQQIPSFVDYTRVFTSSDYLKIYSILDLTLSIPSNLTKFRPGLRIPFYDNKHNDVNIFISTLETHAEEYKYMYEYY